jgi:hypothetical protein
MELLNMKKILALIVPVLEIGKNGKWSFSRDDYVLYTVEKPIDFNIIFGENVKGFTYLTIRGAKILDRLARANIINKVADHITIDTSISNNIGICGEYTVIKTLGATKASHDDDRSGIDCYLYDIPVQIKSCVHGISELCQYYDTDKKRNGISVINASIAELYKIVE